MQEGKDARLGRAGCAQYQETFENNAGLPQAQKPSADASVEGERGRGQCGGDYIRSEIAGVE